MSKGNNKRIIVWIIAIGVAALFLILSYKPTQNPNRTTILVKAPDLMVSAFQNTFEKLKLDKDYIIEQTKDSSKANFIVQEGMKKEGELIAYSPIVAVFNVDKDYKDSLIKKEIFVTSELDEDYEDFDFNKVIQKAINEKECEFKVYYPSKSSDSWEEFYSFMLFTVNNGYYPNTDEEMKQAKQTVENFLNSKYAEPFNNNTMERSNGIAKNSIYIMAYADLARVYANTGGFLCRVMYPKTVVYHSYYATYDELGKLIYDSLEVDKEGFFHNYYKIGYSELRSKGYNVKYSTSTSSIGENVYGYRRFFNGVEIPDIKAYIYKEDKE